MRERPSENPRPTFLHKRGEFLQPAERVEPGVITAVAPLPDELPRTRLGFARWLVATNNPLTARDRQPPVAGVLRPGTGAHDG
jgi:hypothetical protein